MELNFSSKPLEQAPKGYTRVLLTEEGGAPRFVEQDGTLTLRICVKKQSELNRRKLRLLCRQIIQLARQHKIQKLALEWGRTNFTALAEVPYEALATDVATAFEMANYEHDTYKSSKKDAKPVLEVLLMGEMPKGAEEAYQKGILIGREVNACRELANMPGSDMTPKVLAAAAKAAIKGTKATVKVLGRKEMEKLGMGAVLGVAKGSAEEPQFIIMEYKGGGSAKPVVLVGKGVTFDTGGLQVKTGDGMYEMHMDMSGGAAVVHAVALAAKLKVKANVVGLIPAVENAISGPSMRPGDILKSLSGKTIEILHTDAEGRVILADAITYAKRYNPAVVAEASTLTGAALVALGTQASALMASEQPFEDLMRKLGEESGDYVWPFPMWEEYEAMTKGTFADVPNISTMGNSRYGGVIVGGMFLWRFAKELKVPFAHLDIAPRMTSVPGEHLAKGAVGAPVRLFLALIEHHANQR